jgi:predicted DsbA family dithiol-disulfide isomerase
MCGARTRPEALVAAAVAAGLDPQRALEVIERGEYADEVRAAVRLWQDQGIDGVPTMVIDERWLIQGGQSADVIEEALRRIAAEREKAQGG